MSKNLKLIIFIVVLGIVTSGLLIGADTLTKRRIGLNQEIELRSAVLDGFGIKYNTANIHEVYEKDVEVIDEDGLIFYVDKVSGRIAYKFEGSGLWNPIIGLITLDSDFETIVRITVLKQEETAGLGAVVAERAYLDKFVGKKMTPSLDIKKNGAIGDNEVDVITGATGTSEAFELMLNQSYTRYSSTWTLRSQGIDIKPAILDGFGIDYTTSNINDIYTQKVEIIRKGDFVFYVDKDSRKVAYKFEGDGLWNPIIGLITLDSDFETIVRISVLKQGETEGLGSVVAQRSYLDKFVGKKMTPALDIKKDGAIEDNEVDAIAGATGTSDAFELMLNTSFAQYSSTWVTLNKEVQLKAAILDGFSIAYTTSNIDDIYEQSVEVVKETNHTFYVDKVSGKVAYKFEGDGRNNPILGLITLDSDFDTIVRITILEQAETPNLGAKIVERTYLDKFVGKKMKPSLDIKKDGATGDHEVDAIAGATQTSEAFELMLNTSYNQQSSVWATLNK